MWQGLRLIRAVQIFWVLMRFGLDDTLFLLPFLHRLHPLHRMLPWNWFKRHEPPLGIRLRLAFEALGPVYIKFGQALATRRDLLPLDIADELAKLQDRVPPFPGAQARLIVEAAYGFPLERVFADFDEQPLGSASIAQVHPARLRNGLEVVVKVLRPGVERQVRRDLRLMYLGAWLVERLIPDGHRLRAREVIADYDHTITAELDLVQEAANASQTRRNFRNRPILYVPEVHWDLTRRNVLVMERIYGVPINDLQTLRARGVNMRYLAEMGVEIFFTQVFKHNFFHADMHAGNIFVSTENPDKPGYIAVDFGICGSLSRQDQQYIAHSIYAFFNGDYRRVAELHVASGWVGAGTRVDELEAVIRSLCEPILYRSFKDIHFSQILLRLFDMARRFDIEVQPQLVLLQKTLMQIEGLGRELYPELDLWNTAQPFMERWMHEQLGLRGVFNRLRDNLPELVESLPALPVNLDKALRRISDDQTSSDSLDGKLDRLEKHLRRGRRDSSAIVGVGLLICATLITTQAQPQTLVLGQEPVLITWVLSLLGGVFLLRSWRN
jgi:ubiquinone biosynthesis protein